MKGRECSGEGEGKEMVRFVYKGSKFLHKEEATPTCSEDYCDFCGDCLACYADIPCMKKEGHLWVVYVED